MSDQKINKVNIIGTNIDNVNMYETLRYIHELLRSDTFSYVVTANVDHLMKLRKDKVFRTIYQEANLVVADGVPLVWASKIIGTPLKERVNGTDLFLCVCEESSKKGYSIFLLGGNKGVARQTCKVLEKKFPGIKFAGYYCPEFGFEEKIDECLRIQNLIANSNASILFVGLGAPKQEKWIKKFGSGCQVRLAIGVGASFSFVTGDMRRAPIWMQRCGLEWFWRLLNEPRRLWRRYLIKDIPFIWIVLKAWVVKNIFKGSINYFD